MILTFKDCTRTSFIGRNGFGKQSGIEILPVGIPTPEQVITISPITGKGNIANCSLDIPIADIPEVINALLAAANAATC